MTATLRTMGRGVALGLMRAFLIALIWPDDGKIAQIADELVNTLAEAHNPGYGQMKLEAVTGRTHTCKVWMDMSKSPRETKDTMQDNQFLGGNLLDETVVGTGFDGKTGFKV
jgi:hypothetical protein